MLNSQLCHSPFPPTTLYTRPPIHPPTSHPLKLYTGIMATQMKHFSKLPPELRQMVWQQALIPGPGVHFIKPNSAYNGTFDPAYENAQRVHGPGVSEVSSFSAAVEHARLSMVSHEAKGRLRFLNWREPDAYSCLSASPAASGLPVLNPPINMERVLQDYTTRTSHG